MVLLGEPHNALHSPSNYNSSTMPTSSHDATCTFRCTFTLQSVFFNTSDRQAGDGSAPSHGVLANS